MMKLKRRMTCFRFTLVKSLFFQAHLVLKSKSQPSVQLKKVALIQSQYVLLPGANILLRFGLIIKVVLNI